MRTFGRRPPYAPKGPSIRERLRRVPWWAWGILAFLLVPPVLSAFAWWWRLTGPGDLMPRVY